MPEGTVQVGAAELSGIKHIVRLSGIHKDTGRRIATPVKAVTNTTGKPI
jgi:hypothetical protein